MKRGKATVEWGLSGWVIVLLVGVAAPVPEASAAKNLARNPSFELDENQDGMRDDWQPFELHPHRTSQCKRSNVVSHDGRHSAKITQGHLYAAITGTAGWIQRRIVDRGGGKTFRVSVYVRAGKPAQPSRYVKTIFPTCVRLYLFGENPKTGNDYSGAASPIFEIGPEWQEISHTNTFARNIAAVSLILAREAQIGGGDVWFDDVEVREISSQAHVQKEELP